MNYENGEKARCRVCNEKIEFGASKCIHCNSFQSWRRYLVISNSMIALLTALISVTALSSSYILALFQPEYSAIGALAVKVSPKTIVIVAVNNGNRSGAILDSELKVSGFRGDLQFRMAPVESNLINPGQVKEITFNFVEIAPNLKDINALKSSENGLDYLECTLNISLLQYQSMNDVFSQQKNDIERAQKGQEQQKSQPEMVAVYITKAQDKLYLDIVCQDLFFN